MSIFPLPQFETDLEEARLDREAYEKLNAPKAIVVRFGSMRMIGEFPYDGSAKPGCGSKLVVRTHRGTELGEMLTTTCPNSGCGKSVSRQEVLQYIENSGGSEYPFSTEGRVLRIATIEDINEHARLDGLRQGMARQAQAEVEHLRLEMKILDAEPILGGERLTFYFHAEHRVDFRELVHVLAHRFSSRIELRQVGARDEARLIADYEKCGQHCCCRQFLKVLKPVSIKSAKTQKATLDPLKISGRCGRLMCCLRYEDETYESLVAKLPKLKKLVGTPQGLGVVIDRQILTQLVLVRLGGEDHKDIAVPVEEIMTPEEFAERQAQGPGPGDAPDPLRGMSPGNVRQKLAGDRRQERALGAPSEPRPGRARPGEPRPRPQGPEGQGGQRQPRGQGGPNDRQSQFRERERQPGAVHPPGHEAGPRGETPPGDAATRPPAPPQPRPQRPRPPASGPIDLAERAKLRREQQQQQQQRQRPPERGESDRAGGPPSRSANDQDRGSGPEQPDQPDQAGGARGSDGGGGSGGGRRRRRRRGRNDRNPDGSGPGEGNPGGESGPPSA